MWTSMGSFSVTSSGISLLFSLQQFSSFILIITCSFGCISRVSRMVAVLTFPQPDYFFYNSIYVWFKFHFQCYHFLFHCCTFICICNSLFRCSTFIKYHMGLPPETRKQLNYPFCSLCVKWITNAQWPFTDRLWTKWSDW